MNSTIISCSKCGAGNRVPYNKMHLRPKCGRCGQPLDRGAPDSVVELNDSSFGSTLSESSLPVLVDFYSPTCGPCRMLAPVIENLARKYAGRALVGKLDTSRHQGVAARYQIRGVPTLMLFKQGSMVEQVVGAAPQEQIEQVLNAHL